MIIITITTIIMITIITIIRIVISIEIIIERNIGCPPDDFQT